MVFKPIGHERNRNLNKDFHFILLDCPKLESLDLKNNRALKTLNLEDSLTETALTNCIKSISSRGGEIYLKKNQMNAEIWSALKEKGWKVK